MAKLISGDFRSSNIGPFLKAFRIGFSPKILGNPIWIGPRVIGDACQIIGHRAVDRNGTISPTGRSPSMITSPSISGASR